MQVCPSCGSGRVYRSRTRGVVERFRRQFTMKRPYRCRECGWRGWAMDTEPKVTPEPARESDAPPPDLDAVDSSLEALRKAAAEEAEGKKA
jgi:predicted RNA-binding Zn-ribbon protein involved in translation (DUF1610 family)